jgi:large subunit ribosomal protein L30
MSPKKNAAEAAKLQVTLVKSLNGRHVDHIATAASLGLRKIGDVTVQPVNAATQGKLKKIGYLLEVTEVK